MKQMTIRSADGDLEAAVTEMARQRQWSVNQVANYLMRKGLGLSTEVTPPPIGSSLDAFFGVWTAEEAAELDRNVEAAFGQVDQENWS